jgi:hypothetical protein
MQIRDVHLVVVVVVVRGGVVVVVRVVVVVVVSDGSGSSVVVVVVVDVVVVVVVLSSGDDSDDGASVEVVAVAPADCEAGGIGSTAPNSDGSRPGRSEPSSAPNAKSVQVIAPTTAPTASRP